MQSVTFKAGDVIIREGDEGEAAYFIVSGEVEVLIGSGVRRVGALGAGEVFGEMCLIEPGPRSATVRALTDTECRVASPGEFMEMMKDQPDRALTFMKTLVRRLRQMNEVLEKIDRANRSSGDPSELAADRSHAVRVDRRTQTVVEALQEKGFQIRPRVAADGSTRFYVWGGPGEAKYAHVRHELTAGEMTERYRAWIVRPRRRTATSEHRPT
jgi:CRP/FNR family transcriptional regulator, cyclic AMP receptor protein